MWYHIGVAVIRDDSGLRMYDGHMMKKVLCGFIAVCTILITLSGCRADSGSMTIKIREIRPYGNVILDTTFEDMNEGGIDVGDIITVRIEDREYDLPVGTSYTDVNIGELLCRFDQQDKEVALAANYGSFAEITGTAEKQTIEEDPGFRWVTNVDEVTISLKEKEGYLDEYSARNLTRTDAREDYPNLNDEEFANFREVDVTGMKEHILYRSSTPIEPDLGRNEYAMAAMEKAGIQSVINLANPANAMRNLSAYQGSYYSRCAVINPEMGYEFGNREFGEKVRQSIVFMTENDGPYLIHCKEGKDRTGILCGILECFAGATADDVMQDYMITYYNFYNVQPEDPAYSIILDNNIVKTLCNLFQIDNLDEADLREEAEQYLLSIGLTSEQLTALDEKLCER